MTDDAQPAQAVGWRPVPDPTELSTAAIKQAVENIHEWVSGQLAVRDERLRGIDEATRLRMGPVEAFPAQIEQRVGSAEDVLNQKISGLSDLVDERFAAVERQRIEQKADTKAAVDAALSAAKEAVKEQTTASQLATSKSDAATASQLQQQAATFSTEIAGLRRSLEEIKERENDDVRTIRTEIAAVATIANASVQQKQGAKEDRTALYAALGAIGGLLALGALVFATRPTP